METPGSSADGLGDTQLCVAPFLELENAENQANSSVDLLARVPSVCFQEQGHTKSEQICARGAGTAATMGNNHKLTRRLLAKDE